MLLSYFQPDELNYSTVLPLKVSLPTSLKLEKKIIYL